MNDRMHPGVLAQHLLPKRRLTQFAGWVASRNAGVRTTRLIERFIRRYRVDMSEAELSDPAAYPTFNDFFTRALRPSARPIAASDLICPVDGTISQFGAIEHDRIVQAKQHHYTTLALLGGQPDLAERFEHGAFATLYLSPRDYHRIHMPCAGTLTRMIYVPGSLFSVNAVTAMGVPGLFARNERVICVFEGPHGPFVLVLVGATIVGSIATVWHGIVNSSRAGTLRQWHYEGLAPLEKGQEMGRFLLGSTVVALFAPTDPLRFEARWAPGGAIRLGQPMATRLATD